MVQWIKRRLCSKGQSRTWTLGKMDDFHCSEGFCFHQDLAESVRPKRAYLPRDEAPFPTSALKPNRLREANGELIHSLFPNHSYEVTVNCPILHEQLDPTRSAGDPHIGAFGERFGVETCPQLWST